MRECKDRDELPEARATVLAAVAADGMIVSYEASMVVGERVETFARL